MGVIGLFFILLYLFGVAILALLVLWLVPSFRVTISNGFVFVAGGIGGTIGLILANMVLRTFELSLFSYIPVSKKGEATTILVFGSALIGGTALVWLKVRLLGRRRHRDRN